MLHVTNGDCAVERLKKLGIPGTFVPWRDVLHEGPVTSSSDPGALAETRARFLSDQGWASYREVLGSLLERNRSYCAALEREEVIFWFEPDLYDQLQLVEALALRRRVETPFVSAAIAQLDRLFPQLDGNQLAAAFVHRQPLLFAQIDLAQAAWDAFCAPDPRPLAALLRTDTSALPYLDAALHRLLEELPSEEEGLSRCELQAVRSLGAGDGSLGAAFEAASHLDEPRFLGDWPFFLQLKRLMGGPQPLVAWSDSSASDETAWRDRHAELTPAGVAVLAGDRDAMDCIAIDRWLGGTRLTPSSLWRWSAARRELVPPPS